MDLIQITKPYKSDQGQWLTRALFFDLMQDVRLEDWVYQPVFTLYEDRKGYINARKTFVELGDPTGYQWAMKYLGDWNHWLKLMKAPWFVAAYETWISELNTKLKSEAIGTIREIAAVEGKSQLPAARFLAELEKSSQRGRPSKAEVDANLKRQTKVLEQEDEDLARIGLRVVKGGKG